MTGAPTEQREKGERGFVKHLVRIYALAVCFVSVIVLTITAGVAIYDVVELTLPETTLDRWQYERFQSNDNFTRDWRPERPLPDDATLTQLREEGYRIAIKAERRNARQSLTISAISGLLMAALFIIHWKLSRASRRAD